MLGLRDHFRLLGNRSDVDRLLNAADLFVLYSDTEGMPVSLMEAMSAGLPCVASNLEGIAQLIPDETCGTLIPAGDSKLLADTLEKTLGDPEKCKGRLHRMQLLYAVSAGRRHPDRIQLL